jgi:hypothetical protein
MTSELNRPDRTSLPFWAGLWFFGLVFVALAVAEYLYVTDYEKTGGHPPVPKEQERAVRRSIYAKVAEWGHPRFGTWGCVAIFALPAAALITSGELLRRHTRRR